MALSAAELARFSRGGGEHSMNKRDFRKRLILKESFKSKEETRDQPSKKKKIIKTTLRGLRAKKSILE